MSGTEVSCIVSEAASGAAEVVAVELSAMVDVAESGSVDGVQAAELEVGPSASLRRGRLLRCSIVCNAEVETALQKRYNTDTLVVDQDMVTKLIPEFVTKGAKWNKKRDVA